MKKVSLLIIAFITLLGFNACTDDENFTIINPEQTTSITSPEEGTAFVLDPETPTNPSLSLVWDRATFDVPTEVNYTVEIALAGTEFAEPQVTGTTSNNFFTWTVQELNGFAVTAGIPPFQQGLIELRVKTSLGSNNEMETISETRTISVTTYSTEAPRLAVPGNHQGWNPDINAVDFVPFLEASAFGLTDFEGFMWLDGGYKFVGPNDAGDFVWGNIDWGDDTTNTGKLIDDGENNCEASPAGYYYVKADTDPETLTYSAVQTDWGIIGSATPGGWDNDTDLTYDATTRVWTVTLALSADEIKFRANDAWDLNFGDDDTSDNNIGLGEGNIAISQAGTYLVTLDLSNPRAYTYTLELQ